MRAVVFDGKGFEVRTDVDLVAPGADEVLVRIGAAGLCHSDVSVIDGTIPFPPPVVLGHEGAGIVEAVGDQVTNVAAGDHVVLTTLGHCGRCAACDRGQPTQCKATMGRLPRPFSIGEEKVFQFANTGVFAEATVVRESQAIKIDADVPLAAASLIGCGVVTGVGAVLNRARPRAGASAVVIGVGGIGLNVLQGLRLASAGTVIAVDTNPRKEEVARQFGATHFVDPTDADSIELVKEICPDGVDYSFECVGHPALIRTAIDLLDWGGSCVLLGVPKLGTEASFVVASMYNDKSILGCRYGTTRPHHDIPMLVDFYRDGRLLLDELVTRTYPLEDIQQALDDMAAGDLARGVLEV